MMTGRLCFDMAARKKSVEHIARTRAAGHVGSEHLQKFSCFGETTVVDYRDPYCLE